MLRWLFMQLSAIFLGLGEQSFSALLGAISIGKLKTFQLYDRMKARLHLGKLNSENIRKAEPRFWARLGKNDDDFATDLDRGWLAGRAEGNTLMRGWQKARCPVDRTAGREPAWIG